MIYSLSPIPSSPQTGLKVDILLSMIKRSISYLTNHYNYNINEISENISSEIEVLCNEIKQPAGLKYIIDNYQDSINADNEDVKSYLYSILTPNKLNMLRKWILCNENIKPKYEYRIEVILHIHFDSIINKHIHAEQLSNMGNEQISCNLPLDDVIMLIKKSLEKIFYNTGYEYVEPRFLISLLELLKREIYYSNSTKRFNHEANITDNLVRDYLFSVLSSEKLLALKIWLSNNDKIQISNKRELGVITSIYVPDWFE